MSLRVFVSYSSKDLPHVTELQSQLRDTPIQVYVAEQSMKPGATISAEIQENIAQSDVFVLIWSDNARASEWVLQEVGQATILKKEILPIRLSSNSELPESIASLKFIAADTDPFAAMKSARNVLNEAYARKEAHLLAKREQEQRDNLAKLAVGGLLFWLFTHK